MLRTILVAGLIFFVLGPLVASARCVAFHLTSPIRTGTLSGVPVSVDIESSGTNGGAIRVNVEWLTIGGNGTLEKSMVIDALGQYGDRMDAFFAGTHLYVQNAVYLPGQAHCCYTNLAVQRFMMQSDAAGHNLLIKDGTSNVPLIDEWAKHTGPIDSCTPGTYDIDLLARLNKKQRIAIERARYAPY